MKQSKNHTPLFLTDYKNSFLECIDMQIKARNHLSKKDKKVLFSQLADLFGEEVEDSVQRDLIIEEVRTDEGTYIVSNSRIWVFEFENKKIPTIHYLRNHAYSLPKIVVDIGAIKFITNGADVMAPGIVYFDESIVKGSIVIIHEEKANSILGVGKSLVSAKEFSKTKKGKVIKNLHHLRDSIWGFQF